MWVAAQCFAIAGGVLVIFSSYSKTKQGMLQVQLLGAVCCAAASALLGGWAAAALGVLIAVRNDSHKWKYKRRAITGLWFIAVVIVLFADKPGLMPLLAEIFYTAAINRCGLARTKAVLAFNLVLWMCYGFCIGAYPLVVTGCITFASILIQTRKTVLPGGRLFTLRTRTAGKKGEERDVP